MNPSTPLVVDRLTQKYGDLVAVDDVSFAIEEGEVFGLLGPNGAGKTSIISAITTLIRPTAGKITVFGVDVTGKSKEPKRNLGCVPQELINHGFFTLEEILQIHSSYYGLLDNREEIEWLIEKLALQEHRRKKVKELSGGTKRRLLIAKALVHRPRLLLLDEPTAGVDMELRLTLWEFVRELRRKGCSILLTTHYLDEAEQLCDRVAILDHGVIKVMGKTRDVVRDLTEKEVLFYLLNPIPPIEHHELVLQEEKELAFRIPGAKSIGALLAELPIDIRNIDDLAIREGKLEDAFQRVLGKR